MVQGTSKSIPVGLLICPRGALELPEEPWPLYGATYPIQGDSWAVQANY